MSLVGIIFLPLQHIFSKRLTQTQLIPKCFSKPGKVQNCGGLAQEALAPVLRTSDHQPASSICQIDPKTNKTTWFHLNMSLRIGFLESHPVQGWLTTRCPGASLKPSRAYHCPGFTALCYWPLPYPLPAPLTLRSENYRINPY